MFGGFTEQCCVQINDLFVLVVEEIDFCANDTEPLQLAEKFVASFRGAQLAGMPPEPQSDTALAGVIDQLLDLLIGPAGPEALNDVVFKSEFTRQARELFHFVEGVGAAVEISPD